MSDIRIKVDQQNSIKSRVGQQNAVKVVSSISGASGGNSATAVNVIGGIASVTQLNVSGLSTFLGYTQLGITSISQLYVSGVTTLGGNGGITTTFGDLYIGGDLYISDDLIFDEFTARNGNITGILTVGQSIYYPLGEPYGIAYFDVNDQLVSTGSTSLAISETNYIVSTNSLGTPTWANTIDGGVY